MAKHMAGAAVMVVRIHASGIRAATLMIVTIPGVRIAKRQDVMALRRLSRGRLPAERRREHGRQQDGEQC